MKLRGGTRVWAAPVSVLALLLLSGCGELTPGTAAVVNGTKITRHQVDALSDAQCVLRGTLAKAGSASPTSTARIRQESLGLLMDAELSQQFGKKQKIEANSVLAAGYFGQIEPVFKPLPRKAREAFTSVFKEWSKGRAILVQVGSKTTGSKPTLQNLDQLLNAGLLARDAFLKKSSIETDPRYAPGKNGFPGGGAGGSVSKASSAFAKGGSAAKLDAKWLTGLPASQKCG